jgi:large subunit ribosomal protein L27
MAHTKAGGSTRQKGNRKGQRLGVKIYGGNRVNPGDILVRQKGSRFFPGDGVRMGHDFTLYSISAGFLKYFTRRGKQFLKIQKA